jgi:hypothetical protein
MASSPLSVKKKKKKEVNDDCGDGECKSPELPLVNATPRGLQTTVL